MIFEIKSGQRLIVKGIALSLFLLIPAQSMAVGKKRQPLEPEQPVKNLPLQAGSTELRILSFNVKGLPWPAGKGGDRLGEIGRMLAEQRSAGTAPHIVVLQEAIHKDVEDLVERAGYPYRYQGPKGKGLRFASGLILLSEYEAVSLHTMVYDKCTSWDCFTRKGVLHTRINIPELPEYIDIFTTHMNSDPNSDPFVSEKSARAARLSQMMQMRDFILAYSHAEGPTFMPGDFNFRVGSDHYHLWTLFFGYINSGERCVIQRNCSGDPLEQIETDWRDTVDHQFHLPSANRKIAVQVTHYERNYDEKWQGEYLSDHLGHQTHYRLSWR